MSDDPKQSGLDEEMGRLESRDSETAHQMGVDAVAVILGEKPENIDPGYPLAEATPVDLTPTRPTQITTTTFGAVEPLPDKEDEIGRPRDNEQPGDQALLEDPALMPRLESSESRGGVSGPVLGSPKQTRPGSHSISSSQLFPPPSRPSTTPRSRDDRDYVPNLDVSDETAPGNPDEVGPGMDGMQRDNVQPTDPEQNPTMTTGGSQSSGGVNSTAAGSPRESVPGAYSVRANPTGFESGHESSPELATEHPIGGAVLVDDDEEVMTADVSRGATEETKTRKHLCIQGVLLILTILISVAIILAAFVCRDGCSASPTPPAPTMSPVISSLSPQPQPSSSPEEMASLAPTNQASSVVPSSEPSLAPTPEPRCFENWSELTDAVDAYLQDNSSDTATAKTYGWPIGSWCIDHVTRLDGLFSAERNGLASSFNEDLSGWNTSAVTDMSYLFQGASEFNQDLSSWDTSEVGRIVFMFENAVSFNGDIGAWDVSKVWMFEQAFLGASSLNQSLPWDLRSAEDLKGMFKGCTSFNGDIRAWNTILVDDVESMFEGASSFDQDLSLWNLPRVTSLQRMFAGATAFNGDITDWDVSRITSFRGTFDGCSSFTQDLSRWDVSSGRDFTRMFAEATSYSQDLCSWHSRIGDDAWVPLMFYKTSCDNTTDPNPHSTRPGPFCSLCDYSSGMPSSSAAPSSTLTPTPSPSTSAAPSASDQPSQTPASGLPCFANDNTLYEAVDAYLRDSGNETLTALQYGWPIGDWCVSEVSSFFQLFSADRNPLARTFNEDVSQWTTSSVTNMESMFKGAENFNQDLSAWNTSLVTTFGSMFEDASAFNGDVSLWDTSRARSFRSMFENAQAFNGRLGGWNTGKVEDMSRVFRHAQAFNQDISPWDVSRVRNMDGFFRRAEHFNQDLPGWDVSRVERMSGMFEIAIRFNGDIRNWNISSLAIATEMFRRAESFNQDLSAWDIPSTLFSMQGMFQDATSFNGDITSWDVSNVPNFAYFLQGATSFNQDLSAWDIRTGLHLSDMFHDASSFRQNLCGWNFRNPTFTRVSNMFTGTDCPSTEDPDLSVNPVTPVCFRCT